jgi:hypothetical protein
MRCLCPRLYSRSQQVPVVGDAAAARMCRRARNGARVDWDDVLYIMYAFIGRAYDIRVQKTCVVCWSHVSVRVHISMTRLKIAPITLFMTKFR